MTDKYEQKGVLYLNVICQIKHHFYITDEKQEGQANTFAKVHWFLTQNKENAYIKRWWETGCVYN